MSGKSFKTKTTIRVTLSDGETVVRVRKLKMMDFLATGKVPEVIFKEDVSEEVRKKAMQDPAGLMAMYRVAFIRGIVSNPDFIPVDKEMTDPESNEVCMADMNENDLVKILNACITGGAGDPQSFPDDKAGIEKSQEHVQAG